MFVHAGTRAKARVVISGVAVLALMVIGAPLSGWAQDPAPSESAIASPAATPSSATPTAATSVSADPVATGTPVPPVSPSAVPAMITPSELASSDAVVTPTASAGATPTSTGASTTEPAVATPTRIVKALAGVVAPLATSTTTDIVVSKRVMAQPLGTTGSTGTNYANTVGTVFRLWTSVSGAPGVAVPDAWATCTITTGGACTITVPNTQAGGANVGKTYFVVEETPASGTFANPVLKTNEYTGPNYVRYYPGLTEAMVANTTQTLPRSNLTGSGTGSTSSGDINSFGAAANSLVNPTLAARCTSGLNIAIQMDLSASLDQTQRGQFRDAIIGTGGLLDALTGTGSNVATFTFNTSSPATNLVNHPDLMSIDTDRATINAQLNDPDFLTSGTYTNWDRALRTVANATPTYDVLLFITDGAPNYISNASNNGGVAVNGSNVTTRSLEAAIYSANALKAEGTRIVSVGVGAGITGAGQNLRAVSGTTLNSDYFQTASWTALKEQLTDIASAATCQVPIKVTKHVPSGANLVLDNGWTMSTTPSNPQPTGATAILTPTATSQVTGSGTNPTGETNWSLKFNRLDATASVTIAETSTSKPGYVFVSGSCTVTHGDATTTVVTLTNTSTTLTGIKPTDKIVCDFVNRPQARLTLVKSVVPLGAAAPGAWTLTATGPTPVTGAGNSVAVTNQVVTPGTYALSETGGPTGFIAGTSWSCAGRINGASTPVVGTSVTLVAGDDATCTIVNTKQTRLTLVKSVVPVNAALPGAWTLTATGPTPLTGAGNSAAVTNQVVTPGTYALSETGGPVGFVAGTSWSCVGATGTGGTSTSVVLAIGDDATCTIINTKQTRLTLVKSVVPVNAALPSAWTLAAAGPTPITGPGNSVAVTNQVVTPGTYALTEFGGPLGFVAGTSWSCTGTINGASTPVVGTAVTLVAGDDATCTIVNTKQTRLTLVKSVVPLGAADPGAWTLTATGPTPVTGAGNSVAVTNQVVTPGTYSLSESGGPAGFAAGTSWTCTGTINGASTPVVGTSVTLVAGDDATCTIVNTQQTIDITVIKRSLNCDVGVPSCNNTLPGTQFTLYASDPQGPTPGTGTVLAQNPVGSATFVAEDLVVDRDYWLVETKAPAGFQLLAQPVKFHVTLTQLTLDASTASSLITADAQTFTVTVTDVPAADLPKVGGDGTMPYLALGLLLVAGSALYYRRMSGSGIAPRRAI